MMNIYSGKHVDTLANGDLLFLLEADARPKRGACIFINTVPFKVRSFEVSTEGLLVQVTPVEDPF